MKKLLGIAAFALVLPVALPLVARAQEEPAVDPIFEISIDMHSVVGKLTKLSTDQPTQETQKEVITKLDALIAQLEKECEACKGSKSGANPSKPAADSVIKGGPGGIGKLHSARDQGDKWGELPPHERDRILQSLTDGFPAHYQNILERYYKRLADEKPVGEADSDAPADKNAPSDRPAKKPAAKTNGVKDAKASPAAAKPAAKSPAATDQTKR